MTPLWRIVPLSSFYSTETLFGEVPHSVSVSRARNSLYNPHRPRSIRLLTQAYLGVGLAGIPTDSGPNQCSGLGRRCHVCGCLIDGRSTSGRCMGGIAYSSVRRCEMESSTARKIDGEPSSDAKDVNAHLRFGRPFRHRGRAASWLLKRRARS